MRRPESQRKNERDAGKTAARRRRSRARRRRCAGDRFGEVARLKAPWKRREKVLCLLAAACRAFTLSHQHQRGDGMQSKAMHQRPSPSPQGTQCQGAYLNLMHSCTVGYVFEKSKQASVHGNHRGGCFCSCCMFEMIVRNLLSRQNVFMVHALCGKNV